MYPASLRWPATLWLTESWPSTTAPALTPRREGLDGAVDTEWVGCCVHAFGCLCSSVCMRLSACCVPALCMLGPCACLVSANFMLWRFITLLHSSGWNIRSIHAGCGSTCSFRSCQVISFDMLCLDRYPDPIRAALSAWRTCSGCVKCVCCCKVSFDMLCLDRYMLAAAQLLFG